MEVLFSEGYRRVVVEGGEDQPLRTDLVQAAVEVGGTALHDGMFARSATIFDLVKRGLLTDGIRYVVEPALTMASNAEYAV